ncbi:hypothetical protein FQR65_LT10808 [Abscondita terminalis]|nr:hypothetical protein FQR65_LT10808 [Abscondita terminalis]
MAATISTQNHTTRMSDEATTPSKRGRKAVTEKTAEKAETKKRQRKEVKQVESGDEDGVGAPKRGRGRPKGSTKKKAPAKPKGKTATGRRGRPKKDNKSKDSGDEDNEENDEEDD